MKLRLSVALGSSAESWLGHQAAYDLWEIEQRKDTTRAVPLFALDLASSHTRMTTPST